MAKSFSGIALLPYALALASGVVGCAEDKGPVRGPMPQSDASYSCIDMDFDGYGVGCLAGEDCDDTNAAISDQCLSCLDDAIQEGCECEPQVGMQCVPPPIPHPEGLLICREGTRYCRDALWTACEPLGDYVLVRR